MQKKVAAVVGVTLAITLIGGCSQLEVRRYTGGNVEGIPYVLPKKTVLLAVEYEVEECSVDRGERLKLTVKKTATATQVVEPGESFYIPYDSIRNFFKDNDITVEAHETSTLKSMTAHSVDKTGEAIKSIVELGIKAASWSTKGPAATSVLSADRIRQLRGQFCRADILQALDEIATLKAKAKPDDGDSAKLVAQRDLLKFKQVSKWTPQKPTDLTKPTTISIEVYPKELLASKWLTPAGLAKLRAGDENLVKNPDANIPTFVTEAKLDLTRPIVADPSLPDTSKGVVFRYPMMALLLVCDGKCPTAANDVTGIVGSADIVVSQLGDYITLPLHNRIFQDQKIELVLSKDGLLEKVGVNSKATAASALQSVNTSLDQIKTYRTAEEEAKEAARTAAANSAKTTAEKATAINQAIASCLAAQKALKEVGGVPVGTCQ